MKPTLTGAVLLSVQLSFAVPSFAAGPPATGAPAIARPAMPEILVTATPLDDLIQPAEVLDAEALLLRNAPSLGETLERSLGVSSSYFGPAASRPIIRGLGGSRVTVLVNAVSTLDVSDISPDHAVEVEPLLADSIEIVRGPATLLFGSSAAGGVVNVIDGRIPRALPESGVTGALEVRGDTAADEFAQVGRLDGGLGQLAWHLEGYNRNTNDIDIDGYATADPLLRPADEPRGTLPNSYSEKDGYGAGASWVTGQGYLGVAYSQDTQNYGLPGPAEEGGDPAEELLFPGPYLDMDQSRVDVRGEYRPEAYLESVKLSYGNSDYKHNEVEPTGEVATQFKNDAWQLRLETVHKPIAGWKGAVGLQVDDRDFSALGAEAFIPQTTTKSWGLFVSEQRDMEWGALQLGARVEPLKHTPDAGLPAYDATAWSVAGGIAYDLTTDYRLTSHVSRTERQPAIEELYSDGAHFATRLFEVGLLAQPDGSATQEVSTNLDLGIARAVGSVQWSVALFYNAINDFIYQETTTELEDGLPVAPYVQADASFYGAEAELTFPLMEGSAWQTNGRVFADFVHADLNDGGELPRIPPWRAGFEAKTSRGPWSAGVDAVYYAQQAQVSSFETDAFTMVGVNVTYELDAQPLDWEFFVRGTNLLNEAGRRSASYLAAFAPLPGASLEGGIRTRF